MKNTEKDPEEEEERVASQEDRGRKRKARGVSSTDKNKNKNKLPHRKRESSRKTRVSDEQESAPVPEDVLIARLRESPGSEMNDETMHDIVTRVFSPFFGDRVAYVSSINLQLLLSKAFRGAYDDIGCDDDRSEQVLKDLGIASAKRKWSVLVAIIHGPHTERKRASFVYGKNGADVSGVENTHWSLLVWFKEQNEAFHYDSLPANNNTARCGEVISALHLYGVIPERVSDFIAPQFTHRQREGWECGYYALLFLRVIQEKASRGEPMPISKQDMETTYRSWVESITSPTGDLRMFLVDALTKGVV